MDASIEVIPYRDNRSIKFGTAAPVIELSGEGLPTQHPVGSYLAGLRAKRSRQTMLDALASALVAMNEARQLCEVDEETSRYYHQQVWKVRWEDTRRPWMKALYLRLEKVRYSPRSRMKIVVAIRGVLRECRLMGLMDAEPFFQCTEGFKAAIKDDSPPVGRAVGLDEIVELLRVCDADQNRAKGTRDGAIISIGWEGGPRASEVVNLKVQDYSPKSETIKILHSKNGKSREIPVQGEAKERLDAWLAIRGKKPGQVFTQVDVAGNVFIRDVRTDERRLKPLTRPDAVSRILARRIDEADLLERFTFHDLRRTAATELSRDSGIELAQKLLGHSSITTTQRYRKLDQSELRAAMVERDKKLKEALNRR